MSDRTIKYAVLREFTREGYWVIVQRVIYSAKWRIVPRAIKRQVQAKFPEARLLFFVDTLVEHYNGDNDIREEV